MPWLLRAPLAIALMVIVIGIAAGLIAMQFFPAIAGIKAASDAVDKKIHETDEVLLRIKFPQTSSIYDANGKLLTTVSSGENRDLVKLKNISQVAQDAVLAIEDHNFYEHGGIDTGAIIRAALSNFLAGEVTQGGSTLTQQLVKNAIIGSNAQTFERKFQEAVLASRMEREYSKGEILELYMNQVYLANGVYGFGTAAEYYFNKKPSQLSLPQSALLAGMVQLPNDYDPIRHTKAAKARRDVVLDQMAQYGFITEAEAAKARKKPVKLKVTKKSDQQEDAFFTHHVIYELLNPNNGQWNKLLGQSYKQRLNALGTAGYRIYTTYDPKIEAAAQNIALRQLGSGKGLDAAVASVVPETGEVKLLLSGKDYERDGYNLVAAEYTDRGDLLGVRQPGSSFKPFTLLAAFEEGIPASTTFPSNSPMELGPEWPNPCNCVANAEPFGGYGNIDLWTATAHSVNVVFAQLALQVGPDKIVDVAQRAGVKDSELEPYPSITLGSEEVSPLEQASGYATIANHGTYCKPYMITRIVGPKGNTVYRAKPDCREVIDPKVADLTTNLLQGVVTGGTGGAAAVTGHPIAGKTGTSQDQADLWFVGYTPQMSTAVWVGNPTRREPTSYFGGTIAAPIFSSVMDYLLRGLSSEGFKNAEDVKGAKDKVPDVVGMTEEEATQALTRAGFSAVPRDVDSDQPKGTVIAQSPSGGSQAPKGASVTIEISNGKSPEAKVPGVTGMVLYEAQQTLKSEGFGVSVSYVDVSQKDKNRIVLSQSPGPGATAEPGATITITVGQYVGGGGGGGGDGGGDPGGGGGGGDPGGGGG